MSARRRLIHPPPLRPVPPSAPPGILVVPTKRDTIVDDAPPVAMIEASPRSRPLLWLFAAMLVLLPPAVSTYAIVAVRSDAPSAKDVRLAQRDRPLAMKAPRIRSR